MIRRSFIFFLFILIRPFTLKAEGVCNETLNCGSDISEKTCVERGCCYLPSVTRAFDCVRRSSSPTAPGPDYFDFLPEIPPNEEEEYYPPDAIQLTNQLSSNLKRLLVTGQNQVTPSQAIGITSTLNDYLWSEAYYGSDKNWEMSEKGIFFAKIIVERDSFNNTFLLKSNTLVQLHPFREETWNEIAVLIIVEYFTPIDIWTGTKQISEMKKSDNCPNSKPVWNNSTVVSVTAFNENRDELLNIFEVEFKIKSEEGFSTPESLTCEMLNETIAEWTRSGCELTKVSKDFAVCSCNHTANKYVLMDTKALPFSKNTVKLTHVEIVEFVMEGLSFGSLSITLITLIFLHQRKAKSFSSGFARAKEKIVVHANFVAALTGLHLTKLISEVVYTENFACEITVVFSHYFMLASGMWMLIESLMLYFTIMVKSLKQASTGYLKLILGWGIPAAIVVISAAIGISNGSYIKRDQQEMMCAGGDVIVEQPFMSTASDCSINFERGVIWSVIGPLLAIFVINLFVLSHTVGFVIRLNVQTKSKSPAVQHVQYIWNATKGILVLLPILGIPWLIGFFRDMSTNYVSLALQYVYVMLNGLQGFFIFILYCGCNKEAHKAFKRVTNRKARIKFSQSRSGNNSTMSLKDWIRKSRLMGCNVHKKQHRPYTNIYWRFDGQTNQKSLQNNLQRTRSASFSSGTNRLRIKRRNRSVTLIDISDSGLKRAWSTKSLYGGNNRPSVIPGLNLEPGQPSMIAFNFEKVTSSEPVSVMTGARWPRSTVKEFSRFSVIPEELKRASVLETLVLETNSDEVFYKNDKIIKEKTDNRNEQKVIVDVHKFPREKIKTRRLMSNK